MAMDITQQCSIAYALQQQIVCCAGLKVTHTWAGLAVRMLFHGWLGEVFLLTSSFIERDDNQ
jgi:hypothetical protein